MPTDTKYDPQNVLDYKKSKLNKDARGVIGTITAGQTGTIDLTTYHDYMVSGGNLLVWNANIGDKCHFQVVMGQTVISQYVTDWFINSQSVDQKSPIVRFPAKLPAGLTLRIVYVSTGSTNVNVAVNYDLEKVLE